MKLQDLTVSKWLGTTDDFSLNDLQGRIVLVHAFQMLCPGCVLHGVPQAQKVFEIFKQEKVAVLGLHTVFEHHEAMGEISLKAFLHEFRVKFPVGIDEPTKNSQIPKTMSHFQLQGTPSWLIFDQNGELRANIFGQMQDLILGAEISRLLYSTDSEPSSIYKTPTERKQK